MAAMRAANKSWQPTPGGGPSRFVALLARRGCTHCSAIVHGFMCYIIATGAILITACSLHAGFAGFEVGNGVALTGGVVRVNYMGNKSHTLSLGPRLRFTMIEVQLTMTNGRVKKNTMIFVGTHALRAPLPIQLTETLATSCSLGLLCGMIALVWSKMPRAEPGAPPNGGTAAVGNSGVTGGPPSVS